MAKLPAFEVDKRGLEKVLARRGKAFAALELVQNAFDENVSAVHVRIESISGSKGYHRIVVEDDSPEGFADLSHAYTLFAESKKKSDPNQRGRFNLGEKLVLACCRRASIETTTGTIRWEGDTREHSQKRTEAGSVFSGEFRMNVGEALDAIHALHSVIVPDGVSLFVNQELVPRKVSAFRFDAALPTEISNNEGYLSKTIRKTEVRLYATAEGETATIYELGIPVVDVDGPYHINIQQKIPLNSDRDNVTPSYLKKLLTLVLSKTYAVLTDDQARAPWVGTALESGDLPPEAVDRVLTARYGDKRVIRDPSDVEGTKIAMSRGFAVIEPGSFSKEQWATIKASGAVLPAGQVTPSPKPYDQEGGSPNAIEPNEWSPGMYRFYAWAVGIAQSALGVRLSLTIVREPKWGILATWGNPGKLVVNLSKVGHKFFDNPPGEEQLSLLIHEMGHAYSGDHLSSDYHHALCDLGAKLAYIGAQAPGIVMAKER